MADSTKYVAIIDAGSTSSRLLIYSYKDIAPTRRYTEALNFTKICEKESKEPISGAGDEMAAYLKPLLNAGVDELRPKLPITDNTEGFYMKVPLYVMATAGMRDDNGEPTVESRVKMRRAWDAIYRLRGEEFGDTAEVSARRRVYDIGVGINQAIPNNVRVNAMRDHYSFVVPAKDEGVYAWIALNHGRNQPDSWMPGVLELGGKSMQVAYADATDAAGKPVCLWKNRYYVKSQSWVLGAEASRAAAVETKLIRAADRLPGHDIYNPCLPAFQRVQLDRTHTSIGTGNFARCLAMAESYLNSELGTGSLSSLDIQHLAGRFYGTSSFWYTNQFFAQLDLYKKDSPYDPQLFRQAVDQYCTSSWLKPFPWIQGGVNKHIHKHCFAAAWMITLFHDRKGFQLQLPDQEAWKDLIHFPEAPEVADRSSWTLGAATMHARHGSAKVFCRADEVIGIYPPRPPADGNDLVRPTYNQTAVFPIPSSPTHGPSVVVAQPTSSLVVESAQLVHTPNIPTAVASSLLPSLPLDALNPGSTFSVGLISGVLLIALVLIGYRRFSTRRVAVQLPVSEDKHTVEVNENSAVGRTRRAFFDKAKGAIVMAGGDSISCA